MQIKMLLLTITLLCLGVFKLYGQDEKIIKYEAKYYCQCNKKFNKKANKIEKKRKQEKDSKLKKYKPGEMIFGGYALEFSFEDCLNKKRNKNTKIYIESLEEDVKGEFRKKVQSEIKKQCPQINPIYY